MFYVFSVTTNVIDRKEIITTPLRHSTPACKVLRRMESPTFRFSTKKFKPFQKSVSVQPIPKSFKRFGSAHSKVIQAFELKYTMTPWNSGKRTHHHHRKQSDHLGKQIGRVSLASGLHTPGITY